MKLLAFCPLLLALSLHYGTCQQESLETLPSDAQDITCTGDLQCDSSDALCIFGDLEKAEFPVLVPTEIRAKTVKRCDPTGCRLRVQVTMDMSVMFISDISNESLGSGDCGDYDDYDDEDLDDYLEDDEMTDVSLYIRVNKSSNDSLLCANLFILREVPSSHLCSFVRVSLPPSSIPQRTGTSSSIKVGTIVYNSINSRPGNEWYITSYTHPRYNEELHVHHRLPGCMELDPKENILECEAPSLEVLYNSTNVSVRAVSGASARNTTLRVFYKARHTQGDRRYFLYGRESYEFPKSDIVPCLCFEAWYSGLEDAVRTLYCPFKNYSEARVWNESRLTVKREDNILLCNLTAPCNLSPELSLCWNHKDDSECHEIPHSRKQIFSEQIKPVILENLHPSLCLQVSVKGKKVLHTYCLPTNGTQQPRNEATDLVLKRRRENASLCIMGRNKCITLENATSQMERLEFLDKKILEDVITDQCVMIFKSGEDYEVFACSVEKYLRSTWIWPWALCLFAVACVMLVLLLKNENLKKWLKSMTAEKSLSEIFNNRRILLLYSPDNQEYEHLVRVFASSLKDLQLDVILDQWHRIKMSEMNPLPWYHQQKSLVFEKEGLIILLFSEGAREKYIAWQAQDASQRNDPDPYHSFGAVLNCVESDFCSKKANGRYVVVTLGPSHPNFVPKPFNLVPVYDLPICLEKLLKEIAGSNAKKLGHKQVNRLSNKIRDKLSNKDKLKSVNSNESVAVELQPLVQNTGNVSENYG